MIREARLIAVEGAHGTGKTTLVHALASRLKEQHVQVGVRHDAARESPLIEDVIVHARGEIDLATELHLFGCQIAGEQALSRVHNVVLCDKSLLSVVAYGRLFLENALRDGDAELFAALRRMCHVYASRYDAIFLLEDLYPLDATLDPHRLADEVQRADAASLLAEECRLAAPNLQMLPTGLNTDEKLAWVLSRWPEGDGR